MAVPYSVTVHNLNGTFVMNKELSDPFDAILGAQQVSWVVRKAAGWSSITITVKQYDDDNGLNHIDAVQSASGWKSEEERVMDWTWGEKKDNVFGAVRGRSRICKVDEIQDDWLKADLDPKSLEASDNEVINSITESTGMKGDQWVADQVWGFEIINGQRKHVRRIHFIKGTITHRVKNVYDWVET